MSTSKFPKAWAIGHRNTENLWDGKVEITEKLDGSQFGFGIVDGELVCRSKNQIIHVDDKKHMFYKAIEYINEIQGLLIEGYFYYAVHAMKVRGGLIRTLGRLSPESFANRIRAMTVHIAAFFEMDWSKRRKVF